MPKITKINKDGLITYFYDGVKKYTKYKKFNGIKEWMEFNKYGEVIRIENSDGYKWQIDIKERKKEIVNEKDVKPFEFSS